MKLTINERVNKWGTEIVLQGNYGHGWEDLAHYDSDTEARVDLKAYRDNERGVPFRIITRKVQNPDYDASADTRTSSRKSKPFNPGEGNVEVAWSGGSQFIVVAGLYPTNYTGDNSVAYVYANGKSLATRIRDNVMSKLGDATGDEFNRIVTKWLPNVAEDVM